MMMMIYILLMCSINYVTVEATCYSGPGVVVDSCTCHETCIGTFDAYFLTQSQDTEPTKTQIVGTHPIQMVKEIVLPVKIISHWRLFIAMVQVRVQHRARAILKFKRTLDTLVIRTTRSSKKSFGILIVVLHARHGLGRWMRHITTTWILLRLWLMILHHPRSAIHRCED